MRWLMLLPLFACSAELLELPPTATPTRPLDPVPHRPTPLDPLRPMPPPPAALTVDFPSAKSLTDASTMTIRGRAFDPDGVAAVTVNGVAVQSDDAFARWALDVSLAEGENHFEVVAVDRDRGTSAEPVRIIVRSEPLLFTLPSAVAIDETGGRAILADADGDRLFAFDLKTKRRTVISDADRGVGPSLDFPAEIALDLSRDRAIVLDSAQWGNTTGTAIYAVDLTTGDRTILASETVGAGPILEVPKGFALDDAGETAFVVDATLSAVVAIDLTTGDRSIVSDFNVHEGRPLWNPAGLLHDGARNRLLVLLDTSGGSGLVAVDLTTGIRTSITERGYEFGHRMPDGIVEDFENNRVIVATEREIIAIDLSTAEQTVLSGKAREFGVEHHHASGLAFERQKNRLHLLTTRERGPQYWRSEHLLVDVASGIRTKARFDDIGEGLAITHPGALTYDPARGRALVADRFSVMVAIDLETGLRTQACDPVLAERAFFVSDVALDPARGRTIVLEGYPPTLTAVDLVTGEAKVMEGTGPNMVHFTGIAVDTSSDRAILTGYFAGEGPSLMSMNLQDGARQVLIDMPAGRQANLLTLRAVALDLPRNRAFVTNTQPKALAVVDLTTGESRIIADAETGTGPELYGPHALLHLESSRRIVLLDYRARVIEVDLGSGARAILSDFETGRGPAPARLVDMVPASPTTALLVDEGLDALLLLDLLDGQRVILSGPTYD